jgi:NADP-dependent 3-hydroxy acid dehydrogenase YdfG
MQEQLFRDEGREYRPERLLQPDDVASIVLAALALPWTAEVTDIHIRPMLKE